MRRATATIGYEIVGDLISIHALREESDPVTEKVNAVAAISIHALREESDTPFSLIFYTAQISIHALREESDW